MLPSFCKCLLKSGSYVVLVVTEEQFTMLRKGFQIEKFKVCDYSYKVLYDPKMIKRRRNLDFPQQHDDICLISKTQGSHPDGFVPEFATISPEATAIPSTNLWSVNNIRACTNKLKAPKLNSPLYPDERSVDLFTYLVRLFSPPNGSVLDPFGGPLSVPIACLETARRCVALEESENFKYSVGRLRV